MTKELRAKLIRDVFQAAAAFQSADELIDNAVAERLQINRTDLRCLALLLDQQSMTAGQLAQASGMSSAAITMALDRLERAGLARRARTREDRRNVLVKATPQARDLFDSLYGPLEREGAARLDHYADEELSLLHDFLQEGQALQARHAARIREDDPA